MWRSQTPVLPSGSRAWRVLVPVVEAADDGNALGVGRPHGEANAVLDEVCAEEAMGAAMLAHVEKINIELGQRTELGRVRRRAVFRTGDEVE